jgi:hypothetical protein
MYKGYNSQSGKISLNKRNKINTQEMNLRDQEQLEQAAFSDKRN